LTYKFSAFATFQSKNKILTYKFSAFATTK